MKILHVIPSMSPVHGGPTQALAVMERALAARGLQVETATTDDDGPGRHLARPDGEAVNENGVVRRYFRKSAEFYKPSPSFARWIAAHARDYDVVHIHALFSFTTWAAARACRRRGVPFVVRPLGTLDAYGRESRRPWLKSLSLRWVEAPILRAAAAVHFTSEAEAKQARRTGIAWREAIIPLGIEGGDAAPVVAQGTRVLFLSRLDLKKNLEALIDALPLLHDVPGLELAVAGDGDASYRESLRARAARHGVADRITWLGHVSGAAKEAALAGCGVFVLPSFSENFGIAAAEALAAGRPCVLANGVALAAQAASAGAGLAVEPTPAAIATALRKILLDPELQARMSAAARQLARTELSATTMAQRLEALYRDIVGAAR